MTGLTGAASAVSALAAAALTALLLGVSDGSGASRVVYSLTLGDSVEIKSLHWSCLSSHLPHGGAAALLCTSDDKPIHNVWFTDKTAFVASQRVPTRLDHGYLFHY